MTTPKQQQQNDETMIIKFNPKFSSTHLSQESLDYMFFGHRYKSIFEKIHGLSVSDSHSHSYSDGGSSRSNKEEPLSNAKITDKLYTREGAAAIMGYEKEDQHDRSTTSSSSIFQQQRKIFQQKMKERKHNTIIRKKREANTTQELKDLKLRKQNFKKYYQQKESIQQSHKIEEYFKPCL